MNRLSKWKFYSTVHDLKGIHIVVRYLEGRGYKHRIRVRKGRMIIEICKTESDEEYSARLKEIRASALDEINRLRTQINMVNDILDTMETNTKNDLMRDDIRS